jgi:hypothetical protein
MGFHTNNPNVICRHLLRQDKSHPWIVSQAVLFLGLNLYHYCPGVVHSWNMGNADILVWALVAAALASQGARRGVTLTGAVALKVLPVWALLFAFRERRVWRGAALVALAAVGVTAAGLGPVGAWRESVTWLTRVAPVLGQGEFWRADTDWSIIGHRIPDLSPGNLSLAFLPVQLLVEPGGPLTGIVRLWLTMMSVGGPLAAGWLTRRHTVAEQVAVVLTVSLLLSPILRINYLPALVPCALVWWRRRRSERENVSRMRSHTG